jgi:hypothetical protein
MGRRQGGTAVWAHSGAGDVRDNRNWGLWCHDMWLEGAWRWRNFYLEWGGGGLFVSMLERGDSELFQMLPPRFWVGPLVKWRTHLTSAAQHWEKERCTLVEMVW